MVGYLNTLFHLHRPNNALQYCTLLFFTLEVPGLNLGSETWDHDKILVSLFLQANIGMEGVD